jgi:hypothetical protein
VKGHATEARRGARKAQKSQHVAGGRRISVEHGITDTVIDPG